MNAKLNDISLSLVIVNSVLLKISITCDGVG